MLAMRKKIAGFTAAFLLALLFGSVWLTNCPVAVAADPTPAAPASIDDICSRLPSAGQATCKSCMSADGFWTALGCISTNPVKAIAQLLNFMLGVGGFFVVVQILIGSFEMITSQGNPQALQSARERVTNSIIALLFIVFSVTILEFIGVSVLQLPGFFSE